MTSTYSAEEFIPKKWSKLLAFSSSEIYNSYEGLASEIVKQKDFLQQKRTNLEKPYWTKWSMLIKQLYGEVRTIYKLGVNDDEILKAVLSINISTLMRTCSR